MLKAEITARNYEVRLDKADFSNFIDYENEMVPASKHMLYNILENETAALNVDYDGMFMPSVFFALEADYDTAAERKKILRRIQKQIDIANKWAEKNKK